MPNVCKKELHDGTISFSPLIFFYVMSICCQFYFICFAITARTVYRLFHMEIILMCHIFSEPFWRIEMHSGCIWMLFH